MAQTAHPHHIAFSGAALFGMLLALSMHILAQRFGLNLTDMWNSNTPSLIPASAALAWWLIAAVGFGGGYISAILMDRAISGHISPRMQQILIGAGVFVFVAAGQAAFGSSVIPIT